MDKILSKVSVTTLIILYLFLNGGLYLIGYWSLFKVDFINYIDIVDFPKAFVSPLGAGIGFILLLFLIGLITVGSIDANAKIETIREKRVKDSDLVNIIIFITSLVLVVLSFVFNSSFIFWSIALTITFILVYLKTLRTNIIKKSGLKPDSGEVLMICILLIPAHSFITGKIEGLLVHRDAKTKYVKTRSIQTTKTTFDQKDSVVKYLGKLGSHFILGSLDNERVIIINQSAVDALELYKSK